MGENTNLKNKAIKGVIWSAIEKFSVQGVQFIISIVLARLLTPEDFGLVAIVIVFSTIFQTINESGFNTALVHKLDRDELDYSTAFITNIIIGIASYVILFILAPVIATFYGNAKIISIMRILSLNLIINSIGLVPIAIYTIRINFKTQARASLIAAICSGTTGIISAIIIRNVYAIVIQQITFSSVYVLLMLCFSKWKPELEFSSERFSNLFQYAYKLIGARIISVVFDDIYSLAIGKLYNPAILGCYNRAQSFRQILSRNIVNIVQRVSIPLLCQEQNNYAAMKGILIKFMYTTAAIVYPMLTGLMILSKPIVLVILGEKWAFVSEMLLFSCPVGFFYLISTFNRNIYNATGRTDLALKTEILKKCIFIGIFLLTMEYKIQILLTGLIFISIIEMLIDVYMAKKQIGITFSEEIRPIIKILFACSFMALCVTISIDFFVSEILRLIIGIIIGVISYTIICYILNIANIKVLLKSYVSKFVH